MQKLDRGVTIALLPARNYTKQLQFKIWTFPFFSEMEKMGVILI